MDCTIFLYKFTVIRRALYLDILLFLSLFVENTHFVLIIDLLLSVL